MLVIVFCRIIVSPLPAFTLSQAPGCKPPGACVILYLYYYYFFYSSSRFFLLLLRLVKLFFTTSFCCNALIARYSDPRQPRQNDPVYFMAAGVVTDPRRGLEGPGRGACLLSVGEVGRSRAGEFSHRYFFLFWVLSLPRRVQRAAPRAF